jgi:4-hydroxybutyrate CoA-transferase
MHWQEDYKRKLRTVDGAMSVVQSDMRIYVQANCAFPLVLLEGLARRGPHVRNVEVLHLLGFGPASYNTPELSSSFRHTAFFIGPNMRIPVNEGRADYIPIHLSEIEELFENGTIPVDIALIHVSTPDRWGYCSMGVSVETSLYAARKAKHIIAQVNPRMPRTLGNSQVHVSELDAIVEVIQELPEIPRAEISEEHKAIARHIAPLIEDGACLQTGIGSIPDAILPFLADRKDLGVHTETLSEGAIPLIESGVITGRRKSINRNKIVLGFALGTRRLYDFVDENPIFEFQPNSYTNDPFIISQNENVVAINSALEVDITGQVCSGSIGPRFYSGFGGQLDFIRGAARSKGGKPIIALPSTAKNGTISRIKPMLTLGAGVVTTRADVHYVVTEFGIAYLHGKTIRQRAEALINIAHPNFRAELTEYCEKAKYISTNREAVAAMSV